jgi:hypothetical protein
MPERQPNSLSGKVANPVVVQRGLPLFGLRTRRKLPYMQAITLNGGASVVTGYVFSANGCFDPNITGTGHQPMGFDQMMVFYNHYTVLRARVTAMFENTGTPTSKVGLSISGSTTFSTDYEVNIENGQLVWATIQPAGTNGSTCALKTSVNCAAFQGLQNIMDDPDMRGDIASNPIEQLYFLLTLWNTSGATVPVANVDVLIEYDVVFHEPKKGTLS